LALSPVFIGLLSDQRTGLFAATRREKQSDARSDDTTEKKASQSTHVNLLVE
jgi:hypothetical protein